MGRRLPLSQAAIRLGRDYQQVRRLLLRGTLVGGRDEFGRFFVEEESVDRLKAGPAAPVAAANAATSSMTGATFGGR
jgi:hypothetical protein